MHSAWDNVRGWTWHRWATVVVAVVGSMVLATLVDVPSIGVLRSWSENLGVWFIAAFIAAYVFFTQFPIPRTVWTLAAGLLFLSLIHI